MKWRCGFEGDGGSLWKAEEDVGSVRSRELVYLCVLCSKSKTSHFPFPSVSSPFFCSFLLSVVI